MKLLMAMLLVVTLAVRGEANTFEKRVALVIGNGAYTSVEPLRNPRNDAEAVSASLKELGFVTVDGYDLTGDEFRATVREFARLASDADLTLFFYAGHGLAVDGRNYLIPVDAKMAEATSLDWEAIEVDFVAKQMQRSDGVSLVVLDACRNNPLARTLSRSLGGASRSVDIGSGLARMDIQNPGRGMAIAFATAPGDVALDGEGEHSPFTTALLKHISAPDTDFTEVMSRVTGDVYSSTNEMQRPWLNSSLTGRVALNVRAVEPAPEATETETGSAETANASGNADTETLKRDQMLFQFARESNRIEDYEAYLETFPECLFSAVARKSIERLQSERSVAVASAQTTVPAPATPAPVATLPVFAQPANPIGAAANPAPVTDSATRTVGETQAQPMITPEMKAQPGTEFTEAAMGMTPGLRREIQARLNITGQNVGTPDGQFGPRTRAGITNWQVINGFIATGYLNQLQYQVMATNTQQAYMVWAASNPVVVTQAAPTQRKSSGSSSSGNSNSNTNAQIGAFIGGLAVGKLLNK